VNCDADLRQPWIPPITVSPATSVKLLAGTIRVVEKALADMC